MSRHPELAERFIQEILMDESRAWIWISDFSSLNDYFAPDETFAAYQRIRDVFGVDVSDSSGNLAEIIALLHERGAMGQE